MEIPKKCINSLWNQTLPTVENPWVSAIRNNLKTPSFCSNATLEVAHFANLSKFTFKVHCATAATALQKCRTLAEMNLLSVEIRVPRSFVRFWKHPKNRKNESSDIWKVRKLYPLKHKEEVVVLEKTIKNDAKNAQNLKVKVLAILFKSKDES